ncbi:MAG: ABC transporter substrate-binding protein [SAR324 cluster bacterium]|jgi:peptide/nickel transport system substrate-binding protein|nr:ABC transporter substrate-binding protein [Deltaproteobacteria bacterium]MDP6091645.1 ABC transporter substrate-binding protein [SAR324 cluster bacterium]MDP6246098.1 ABC transporter substrate-binding protein [SAR324 cluster bacterium]MDP7138406.1 ABC transporter substrate-binding protein [SAR324 cluster bacterium]MDP7331775.1 ABC transporter substrate-binding protein [SAR324 cluster bacterium]|tara:strand:- start:1870 stop:3462 length:1593 start_codon:yes stop_codon:yes gene_type:complete
MIRKMLNAIVAVSMASSMVILAFVPQTEAASRKDVLVVGMATSDLISLDPAKAFEFSGVGLITQMYDRLLDFPPGSYETPEASLAKSWSVGSDGRTWTFKLRSDAKFHSGNPVTAEDVVYSFARVVTLKDQPSFILTQFGITPDSLKAVDRHTFQVTLDQPYAGGIFLACLAAGVASVVDSKIVKQHVKNTDKYPSGDMGLTWLSTNSAGSGSFILKQWAKNDRVVIDSNADHWAHVPKVKRVVIKEINEATSRRLQVEKGDIDIAWELFPDQVKALQGNQDLNIQKFPGTTIYYMGINVKAGPLADPRVRKAIRYAIDYDGIINNIMGGAAKQINTFIPEGFAGYTSKIYYRQDLNKAKELLKAAGFENGFEIEMDTGDQTPNPELAQSVQNSLRKIGVTVKINTLVSAQLWPKYRAQKHDMIMARWGPDYNDPHTNAQPFTDYTARQLSWRNVYYNEWTSGLIKQAGVEMDQKRRIGLYQQANQVIQEDGPYVFLFQPLYQYGVRRNIDGFYPPPSFDLWKLYTISKN